MTQSPAPAPADDAAHPMDLATRLAPLGDDRFRGHTSEHYANLLGPFGGATAAVMLNAAMRHPARIGEPIALTVNYAGAVADGPFDILARPVRTNRSTQHWSLEMSQPGQGVVTTATAVFARRRTGWSSTEAVFPQVPPPEQCPPSVWTNKSAWPRSYQMRFVRGPIEDDPHGREGVDSVTTMWIRDEPPRPLDFLSLAAICDAFFPRVYVRRRRWVPASTVTLTVYFHTDAAGLAAHGARELLGTARALQFRNGYFDQTGEVWSPAGELFATTHQAVYYRD